MQTRRWSSDPSPPSGIIWLFSALFSVTHQVTDRCTTARNRFRRASRYYPQHAPSMAKKVLHAREHAKRSPTMTRWSMLWTLLLGAVPRPKDRARRGAVGVLLWLSIVHIQYRPTVVRERSLGALRDVGAARRILITWHVIRVGKGLNIVDTPGNATSPF